MAIGAVTHCPQQLKDGLLRTSRPVIFDTETTGLKVRNNRVLSFGFRIRLGRQITNHILFTSRCSEMSIKPFITDDATILRTLEALSRPGLVLVGQNIKFDLAMLVREGMRFSGETRDTKTLLRMLDQDRKHSTDNAAGRQDLTAPWGQNKWLSYSLKDVASNLINIKPFYTPPVLNNIPYRLHTRYLTYDLCVTDWVYQKLWLQMTRRQKVFYRQISSPLTQLLSNIQENGVCAVKTFVLDQIRQLSQLESRVSRSHLQGFGTSLEITDDELRILLYSTYGLPISQKKLKRGAKHRGPDKTLEANAIRNLICKAPNPNIRRSLELIAGYRAAKRQKQDLESKYLAHISADGRIHSFFDEARQTSGRISSTKPNLQQISKPKVILKETRFETEVNARNMVVPRPNHVLLGMDVDQADVRMLADQIATCDETTFDRIKQLHQRRHAKLPHLDSYTDVLKSCFNRRYRCKRPKPLPAFDPALPQPLVAWFRSQQMGDLYSHVASTIEGEEISKNDPKRSLFKTVFLAQLNGQSTLGLGKALSCSKADAKNYVELLSAKFPDVVGILALLRHELSINGQLRNWAGRVRTHTAHYWMVNEKRVHIFMSYKSGFRYWFDVTPLHPTFRNLTCFVHQIWNVRVPAGARDQRKLIYDSGRGRIGTKRYPEVDKASQYHLPVRNLPWSRIQLVRKLDVTGRTPVEQASYRGFYATARSIVNSVMQGGTSDATTIMALRCQPLVTENHGRLLNMIHDELLWEFPLDHRSGFGGFVRILNELQQILQTAPGSKFSIPITVGMKYGSRFGEMVEI